MRCMKCGAEIPEGEFYCPVCASPVQLVPDYSSLESLLAGEISEILGEEAADRSGKTRVLKPEEVRRQRAAQQKGVKTAVGRQTVNMTPVNRYSVDPNDLRNTRRIVGKTEHSAAVSRSSGKRTGTTTNRTTAASTERAASVSAGRSSETLSRQRNQRTTGTAGRSDAAERRRRQELARKKREQKRNLTIIVILLLVIFIGGGLLLLNINRNSYTGMMKKAEKAYSAEQYEEAIDQYTKAARLKQNKPEPYIGIGRCYAAQKQYDKAEVAYLKAIDVKEDCTDAYQELVSIYVEQENYAAVCELFEGVTNKAVLKACAEYIVPVPEFSLDGGSYDKPIEVALKASKCEIHYTMDGSEPDITSPVYSEKIKLDSNAVYSIRAIAFNESGFRSTEASAEYKIEMNGPETPTVSPDSGTYSSSQKITVDVPKGCKVYYTTDGSVPTENSQEYTSPVTMPEGQSIFSCIAINEYDLESSVIRRQYNLIDLD